MELRTIEKLLEKYFDAETSTAEERELKSYFSSQDVAPHLEQYRPLFGYFAQAGTQQFDKSIPLKTKKRKMSVAWMSVAASVVVMLGIFTVINTGEPAQTELGTYEDPEVAFKETQKALNMLSKNVNVGVTGMEYIEEYEKSRKTVFKE